MPRQCLHFRVRRQPDFEYSRSEPQETKKGARKSKRFCLFVFFAAFEKLAVDFPAHQIIQLKKFHLIN
jgi:hypothetical protein